MDPRNIDSLEKLIKEEGISVIAALNEDRKAGTNTDVTIKCKDGIIYAHKCILIIRSQYFKAMFQSSMKEAKTNTINFTASTKTMEIILSFIYAEEGTQFKPNTVTLLEVIEMSHMLQLVHLFNLFWNKLSNSLTTSNFLDVWILAEKYQDKDAKSRILNFLIQKLDEIDGKTIQKLTRDQITTIVNLMENKTPTDGEVNSVQNKPTIDGIVKTILQWGLSNINERKDLVEDIFSSLDLTFMTCGFVSDILNDTILDNYSQAIRDRFVRQASIKLKFANNIKVKIHYCSIAHFAGTTKILVYNVTDKRWEQMENIELPMRHCRSWRGIVLAKGERFFYGMSKTQKFTVYDPVAKRHHFGFRSKNPRISAYTDGNELIFRVCSWFFAVFNLTSKKWKKIQVNTLNRGQVMAIINGKIYFNLTNVQKLSVYNMNQAMWERIGKVEDEIDAVNCQCWSHVGQCKLYFIKKTTLFIYEVKTRVWNSLNVPLIENRIAIVGNCDLDFILFKDAYNLNFWVYYIDCNKWETLPSLPTDVYPQLKCHISYSFYDNEPFKL